MVAPQRLHPQTTHPPRNCLPHTTHHTPEVRTVSTYIVKTYLGENGIFYVKVTKDDDTLVSIHTAATLQEAQKIQDYLERAIRSRKDDDES